MTTQERDDLLAAADILDANQSPWFAGRLREIVAEDFRQSLAELRREELKQITTNALPPHN